MLCFRLIAADRGPEVVKTIVEVSVARRNLKQNSLLLAYAICARSNDRDTKKAAYSEISKICRIPTHLFMFVKFCEEQSSQEGEAQKGKEMSLLESQVCECKLCCIMVLVDKMFATIKYRVKQTTSFTQHMYMLRNLNAGDCQCQ